MHAFEGVPCIASGMRVVHAARRPQPQHGRPVLQKVQPRRSTCAHVGCWRQLLQAPAREHDAPPCTVAGPSCAVNRQMNWQWGHRDVCGRHEPTRDNRLGRVPVVVHTRILAEVMLPCVPCEEDVLVVALEREPERAASQVVGDNLAVAPEEMHRGVHVLRPAPLHPVPRRTGHYHETVGRRLQNPASKHRTRPPLALAHSSIHWAPPDGSIAGVPSRVDARVADCLPPLILHDVVCEHHGGTSTPAPSSAGAQQQQIAVPARHFEDLRLLEMEVKGLGVNEPMASNHRPHPESPIPLAEEHPENPHDAAPRAGRASVRRSVSLFWGRFQGRLCGRKQPSANAPRGIEPSGHVPRRRQRVRLVARIEKLLPTSAGPPKRRPSRR
mmetsp:Transcript_46047/g.127937  ORF Transcript_46047/g.127937 Transcript_46047/m.127937 type:complete len:384 (+) Transcript_46047:697-1848(+)